MPGVEIGLRVSAYLWVCLCLCMFVSVYACVCVFVCYSYNFMGPFSWLYQVAWMHPLHALGPLKAR